MLVIKSNLTWSAYIFGKVVSTSPTLSRIAKVLTVASFKSLFELISKEKVCCGVLNDKFIAMFRHRKGTLYSKNGVKQRAKGRRNENPTVQQFIYNNQAIITGKSLVSGHCSNIRKVGTKLDVNELSSPLRKRKAKSRILKYNN